MIYRNGEKVDSSESSEPSDMEGKEEMMDDGGETALIPKSMFGDAEVKPGDEIRLKVVRSFDDEIEVAYHSGKDKAMMDDMEELESDA